jgi:hypothetical protein
MKWIGIFFSMLMAVSETARGLVETCFNEIREHWTSKTTTVWDDMFVSVVEYIAIGKYTPTGQGQIEVLLGILMTKVTPEVRDQIYHKLMELRGTLIANSIPGDEKAVDFLIQVMFEGKDPSEVAGGVS